MTDYVISAGRIPSYPVRHFGAQFIGARATFCLDADFASMDANVLAIPGFNISLLSGSPVSVPAAFFGMSVYDRSNDSLSGVSAGTVRILGSRSSIDQWRVVQPTSTTWNWSALDSWVNVNYAAGRDIIFTLFGTPAWASARPAEIGAFGAGAPGCQAEPSDMTKWEAFCTAVATRYLGKIKYYEVWNEPNYNNDGTGVTAGGVSSQVFFFSGTWAKLAEMTRRASQAIKAVDPTAKIICPPVQGWLATSGLSDTYFTGMMAASDGASGTMKQWIDIIGVHLYLPGSNLTVNLPGMINRVKASMATAAVSGEIWDTEDSPFSPSISGLSDVAAQAILGRCMIIYAAMGIARTIYYQYDNAYSGISARASILAYREYIINLLKSGGILKVYILTDGRVAYSTSTGVSVI